MSYEIKKFNAHADPLLSLPCQLPLSLPTNGLLIRDVAFDSNNVMLALTYTGELYMYREDKLTFIKQMFSVNFSGNICFNSEDQLIVCGKDTCVYRITHLNTTTSPECMAVAGLPKDVSLDPRSVKQVDGDNKTARFLNPHCLTVDVRTNTCFVSDGFCIRSIKPTGHVTTLMGKLNISSYSINNPHKPRRLRRDGWGPNVSFLDITDMVVANEPIRRRRKRRRSDNKEDNEDKEDANATSPLITTTTTLYVSETYCIRRVDIWPDDRAFVTTVVGSIFYSTGKTFYSVGRRPKVHSEGFGTQIKLEIIQSITYMPNQEEESMAEDSSSSAVSCPYLIISQPTGLRIISIQVPNLNKIIMSKSVTEHTSTTTLIASHTSTEKP